MITVLFSVLLAAADAQPAKKVNPYLPTSKDIPMESVPIEAARPTGVAAPASKWLDNNPPTKRPMGQRVKPGPAKIPLGFTASCKDGGKLYQAQDPGYSLCMENHRKSVEKNRGQDAGAGGAANPGKQAEVVPGVEVKFGDK